MTTLSTERAELDIQRRTDELTQLSIPVNQFMDVKRATILHDRGRAYYDKPTCLWVYGDVLTGVS